METFTLPREFVEHPRYHQEREEALAAIDFADLDPPVVNLIRDFARLPYCFTLQCCYGHFLHSGQSDIHNLDPVPDHDVGPIRYRIAYLALCIENSPAGLILYKRLAQFPAIDRDYVQFGSADWFWERNLNSCVLQVEPLRYQYHDQALIEYKEAQHIDRVRKLFFARLGGLLLQSAKKTTDMTNFL
jgi:hypothetical protein